MQKIICFIVKATHTQKSARPALAQPRVCVSEAPASPAALMVAAGSASGFGGNPFMRSNGVATLDTLCARGISRREEERDESEQRDKKKEE